MTPFIKGDRLADGNVYLLRRQATGEPERMGRLIGCHPHDGACLIFEYHGDDDDRNLTFFTGEKSDITHVVKVEPAFRESLQQQVRRWTVKCFGVDVANDRSERLYRFGEEALELLQAGSVSLAELLTLALYTYSRPKGEVEKEVGQVMLTLAAFCNAYQVDLMNEAHTEADRVREPEVTERIRAKQATKPHRSPLPGTGDRAVGANPALAAPFGLPAPCTSPEAQLVLLGRSVGLVEAAGVCDSYTGTWFGHWKGAVECRDAVSRRLTYPSGVAYKFTHDFVTHRASWREALAAKSAEGAGDDTGYWLHELAAFDKAVAELMSLSQENQKHMLVVAVPS